MNAVLAGTSSLSLPPDSYVYHIAQAGAGLAAISSDDSLRIFDRSTLQLASGGIIEPAHRGLTCLERVAGDHHSIVTAGRDGFVRCWDLRTGSKIRELRDETNSDAAALLSLAICSSTPALAVGTELTHAQATVLVWDYRYGSTPIVRYQECHNDDVTELAYHPRQPTCLLSGSTDGLLNVYETAIPDEEDALVRVMNHGASVHHAGFLADDAIYAVSHDESFAVYLLQDDGGYETRNVGDLRSEIGCEYVVDILPGNGGAVIGAGSHSQHRLDLVSLRSGDWEMNMQSAIGLPQAHGAEIVRTVYVEDGLSAIYTGGEDGLVKAWRVS